MRLSLPGKSLTVFRRIPPGALVMGLDCSSRAIGWAVLEAGPNGEVRAFGLESAPARWSAVERMRRQTAGVVEAALKWRIGLRDHSRFVVEWQSHKKAARLPNAQGLATLGQAQGYLLARLEDLFPAAPCDLVSERGWTRQGGVQVSKDTRWTQVGLLCPAYSQHASRGYDRGRDVSDAIMLAYWRISIR